jgi:5-methylcytosine-specific restriction endonuclease McrA
MSKPLSWYREIFIRDDYSCIYCGREMLQDFDDWMSLEVDHLVPIARGGSDSLDNRVTSCNVCNRLKGSYVPEGHEAMTREEALSVVRSRVMELRRTWQEKHPAAIFEYQSQSSRR